MSEPPPYVYVSIEEIQRKFGSSFFGYISPDFYSLHQPILYEVLRNTKGHVFEFGCGPYSTGLTKIYFSKLNTKNFEIFKTLYPELCEDTTAFEYSDKFRSIQTVDTSEFWLNNTYDQFSRGVTLRMHFVESWVNFFDSDTYKEIMKMNPEIAFLDQDPRFFQGRDILYLKDKISFCIVPRVEYFPLNGIFGKIQTEESGAPKLWDEKSYDFSDIFKSYKVFIAPRWFNRPEPYAVLVGTNSDSDIVDNLQVDWDIVEKVDSYPEGLF